jgi:hypothetical protein
VSYTPSIPVESNEVRGVSGDLALMRGNFQALAPVASGALVSGTLPGADLAGFVFTVGGDQHFRLIASGTEWHFQSASGGVWTSQWALTSGLADLRAFRTVSGVDPTQAFHLTTRAYVDALAAALVLDDLADVVAPSPVSGDALVYDGANWVPGGISTTLAGLDDVDVSGVVDGNTLIYSGGVWRDGTVVSDHGGLTGLADDDHPQYSLADGTRPFTGTVSGIDPTDPEHLATKAYVDNLSGLSISGAVNLPDLLDVDDDVDAAPDGYVLTISGGTWFALPAAGGPGGGTDVLQVQVFS